MLVIEDKSGCTGCGACHNICPKNCISMCPDSEGFLYPNVDENLCIHCSMCKKVCPVINGKDEKLNNMPNVYLAWANDELLRESATSGGFFSAIAKELLNKGGTVFGAAYDTNNIVRHIEISSLDQLYKLSRSKYVQSRTEDAYNKVLEHLRVGRVVLYSGTTCQIYGLLSYLRIKKVSTENLYTMDVICHGTPSPKLLDEYIKWQNKNADSKVLSVAMREKRHPHPYCSVSVTKVEFLNGHHYERAAGDDYYGRFFWGEICSRPSCYKCNFKTIGRISDVTIGDCWFSQALTGKKNIPFDVTLCLAHTDKGRMLLANTNAVTSLGVDTEKAIKCNGGMIYSSAVPHSKREEFFERLGKEPLNLLAEEYFPNAPERKNGFIYLVKETIKLLPGVYRHYYFNQKQKEFDIRCKRKIPESAFSRRVI